MVIADNITSYTFENAPQDRLASNGVDAWANALKGDVFGLRKRGFPTTKDLSHYGIVIANLNPSLISVFARLLPERPKGQKWVALIEGSGDDYLEPSVELLKVLDGCDLVVNINERTHPYIQSLSKTPVHELGIPYPISSIEAFQTPWEQRQDLVLVCPKQERGPSLGVAMATGLKLRAFAPKVSRKLTNLPKFVKEGSFSRDLEVRALARRLPEGSEIVVEQGLPTFLKEASRCRLWVNLDRRTTWARYVLDAAALRVPIVTTASTAHGPRLFPKTTVEDLYAVDEAREMALRLVQDQDFAKETVEYAHQALREYGFESCAERLLAALRT